MPCHLHMIGIGGIGVSALARLYKARGWRVSGSDIARSEITDALAKEGIGVFIGPHRKSNLRSSVTKVIYTTAARAHNPEIRAAQKRRIPTLSYAQAVGELTPQFNTITVAGAHGKSTTTAMIALMMLRAGFDPTVIVGTKLREFGNMNFRSGKSDYLVLEADEYRGSFWNFQPWIAVVTNIDREHLDFYRNFTGVAQGFKKFIERVRPDGHLVLNADNERLARIGRSVNQIPKSRMHWFSMGDREARALGLALKIPGRHNVANALAAYRVGQVLGIPRHKIIETLASYRGAWRRFDYQGTFSGAKVFADYAHHPTEIKATLQAAREKFPKEIIWCVFQPHHYERTRDLFPEFVRAFDAADHTILLDIYEVAGREQKQKSRRVNSRRLAEAVTQRGVKAQYLRRSAGLKQLLRDTLAPGDILIMMGAGSIWEMTKDVMRIKLKPHISKPR